MMDNQDLYCYYSDLPSPLAYGRKTFFKIEKNMKTLDLTNPEDSDIKYKISKFPDGQQAITLDLENTIFSSESQSVVIKSRLNSFLDLELIICANQALIELGIVNLAFKLKEISLYVPYFLGARSDRKFLKGQSNYLKTVICPIINSQNFSRVTVLDPHSDVLEACLNNFQKTSNVGFASAAIEDIDGKITLISPDAGALKKIYDVAEAVDCNDVIVANKLRDLKTGRIIRTEVPGLSSDISFSGEARSKSFVIIDDICDGGRTFIEIAKAIRDSRPKEIFNDKIFLVVTHGIFSAGFEELEKWFTGIYTTNSVKDIDNELVTQINVF
jgi:ribose-phosphate pyrophosphokinase